MILFIDTHLNDIVIILYSSGQIIERKIIKNEKHHSTIIMPTLTKLLNDRIPESIIVVNGPGSFTSVRLGVTIAKTLAYTWNIPIRTINYLEALAVSNQEKIGEVGFNDNNGYYVGKFDDQNNLIGEYNYISNNDFENYKIKNTVRTDINVNYTEVIEYALKKKAINPHEVNPVYIKKLDVEK